MLSYCPGTPQKQNVIRLYGADYILEILGQKWRALPNFLALRNWFLKWPIYLIKYDLLSLVTLQKRH